MSDRSDVLRGLLQQDGQDLAFMVCEAYLGSGAGRSVFAYRLDTTKVIKLSNGNGQQNVAEFLIWEEVKEIPALAKWFAPVFQLSGYGQWLIQARTFPIEKGSLPKKVPTIFTDLKIGNWGWLNGRPVCHDYGSILCRVFGEQSLKLRKADWWQ